MFVFYVSRVRESYRRSSRDLARCVRSQAIGGLVEQLLPAVMLYCFECECLVRKKEINNSVTGDLCSAAPPRCVVQSSSQKSRTCIYTNSKRVAFTCVWQLYGVEVVETVCAKWLLMSMTDCCMFQKKKLLSSPLTFLCSVDIFSLRKSAVFGRLFLCNCNYYK
jgi:hypothetical protein